MTCFWLIQTHLPFSDYVNNFVYCAAFVLSMAAHSLVPRLPHSARASAKSLRTRLGYLVRMCVEMAVMKVVMKVMMTGYLS